jgi:glutamate-1-semialdehyde 2,1-aminomutase
MTLTNPNSARMVREARRLTPGGVHSNVRLSGASAFIERAKGAWLYDVDGKDYVDHLLGQGPNFLGHAPDSISEAINAACRNGMLYGGQHPLEIEAAKAALDAMKWPDMIRFGMSGTEAVHAALRLAKAHTGRRRIIRFEGHYHGWLDNILVANHNDTWGPATQGQVQADLDYQIILPWNDPGAITAAFDRHGEEIAAIITEPMMINVGAIEPLPGYLEHLRNVTAQHDSLLIFDEVICGFRLALGGAAERYGVDPDLATYGKAMAGGWPVAALAGKGHIMERFGNGEVNHSGTFNSNVMGMAAVVAAISELRRDPPYERIHAYGTELMEHIGRLGREHGLEFHVQGLPVAFHTSFGSADAHDAASLSELDTARYANFAEVVVDHGVWVTGRGIWFTSAAHGEDELNAVVERLDAAMGAFAQNH